MVSTLKMVELWGRGGAGRDGDTVLVGGGWFGAAAVFVSALTDLEFQTKKNSKLTFGGYNWMYICTHQNTPELLNRVLFAGEQQPLERFPLEADNQAGSQDGEKGHQDAHSHVAAICSPAHMGTETGK